MKQANRATKNQDIRRSVKNLVKQLNAGNPNPGKGKRYLFKGIYEVRGESGARIMCRRSGDKIEMIAITDKTDQDKVIRFLRKKYG